MDIQNHKVLNFKGIFSGKAIMFTGGLDKMSRSEAKSLAENQGAKIASGLSKKLDILVVGNKKPTKKKVVEAQQLKIKILSEENWNKLING